VFTFLARHTEDWGWLPRTAVALLLTVVVSLLAHRLVERRATELLRHPVWADADRGIAAFARARTEALWSLARQQVTGR
jgi:peptidoglycan/LPS O-acetylase OafA/YrhL